MKALLKLARKIFATKEDIQELKSILDKYPIQNQEDKYLKQRKIAQEVHEMSLFSKEMYEEIFPMLLEAPDSIMSELGKKYVKGFDFSRTDREIYDDLVKTSKNLRHSGEINEFVFKLLDVETYYERP